MGNKQLINRYIAYDLAYNRNTQFIAYFSEYTEQIRISVVLPNGD